MRCAPQPPDRPTPWPRRAGRVVRGGPAERRRRERRRERHAHGRTDTHTQPHTTGKAGGGGRGENETNGQHEDERPAREKSTDHATPQPRTNTTHAQPTQPHTHDTTTHTQRDTRRERREEEKAGSVQRANHNLRRSGVGALREVEGTRGDGVGGRVESTRDSEPRHVSSREVKICEGTLERLLHRRAT